MAVADSIAEDNSTTLLRKLVSNSYDIASGGGGGPPVGFVEIYSGGTVTPAGWTASPDTLFYDGTSVWADPETSILETTHNGDLDGLLDLAGLPINILNAHTNAFNETTIDAILAALDGNGTEDGSVNLADGTNAVPSAAGLTDKASLEGKGWVVDVNANPLEVDMLLRFESGSDTDVLTTGILNAATEGGGGTWSLSATPTVLTISTGAELDVSGIKVSGGSSDDSGGTRGLAIYCGNAQKHANYTLSAASGAVSCGFAFKIGSGFTGATFSTFDMVRMQGEAGEFVVAQFVDFPGASFGLRVHTSGGNGTIIQLTANTWYWVTMKYVANGTSTLSIYSSADFTTLVGSSTRATVNQDCYLVDIGLESFVDGGATNYIDDFALDLDGSQFPLLPTP